MSPHLELAAQLEQELAEAHQESRNHCDHIAALQSREAEMKRQLTKALEENCELREDAKRIDWLADKSNVIGNVQLPTECVMDNLGPLRGAIDQAMAMNTEGSEVE